MLAVGDVPLKDHGQGVMDLIASDAVLDEAYAWLCDRRVLKLVWSYLRRMVCDGGEYEAVTRGISLGCPLSPLMGALYLKPLDNLMERLDRPYVRYMDDWVILAKTRWALRRVVQQVNTILDNLKLEKHPDKTFIGRIDRGFDFLGYRFVAEGLRLAAQTKQRFVERAPGFTSKVRLPAASGCTFGIG